MRQWTVGIDSVDRLGYKSGLRRQLRCRRTIVTVRCMCKWFGLISSEVRE